MGPAAVWEWQETKRQTTAALQKSSVILGRLSCMQVWKSVAEREPRDLIYSQALEPASLQQGGALWPGPAGSKCGGGERAGVLGRTCQGKPGKKKEQEACREGKNRTNTSCMGKVLLGCSEQVGQTHFHWGPHQHDSKGQM